MKDIKIRILFYFYFFQKVFFSINFHILKKIANYVILEVTIDAILMKTNRRYELNKLES